MDKIKATWPGWEVVRVIGQGSFGAVYEIQREMFGKIESAALKVITIPQHNEEIEELRSEGYNDASLTTHFRGYLEDIAREYSLMLDIKGHTNVVYCDDVRYVQHDDGIGWDVFIKMELLSPLVTSLNKAYDEQQVIRLGMDMCNALILCKNENIIHRDIKPQNIFVSKNGDYKLGDFGVAKIADKTVSGTKIGTFKYMAPEVYKSQPYGTSSDLYSLGLVLYWAMNERRTPFLPLPPQIPTPSVDEEARQRRFSGEPVPAPVNGSEELKRIVLKACAFNPADRFRDPAEMKEALARLQRNPVGIWQQPVDEGEKTVGSFGSRFAAPVAPADAEDKTVGTFGGNRYAAPAAPADAEEKTVGTFGGNRYAAPVAPVETEEKTVGAFGSNRCAAPTAPMDAEEKTVGAFGGSRYGASAASEDAEEKTVGAFGSRIVPPVAAPADDGDKTVGAFGSRPTQFDTVEEEEKTAGVFGVGATVVQEQPKVQTPPAAEPARPVEPPKPAEPVVNWQTPGVTTPAQPESKKKKTGLWIALGTVAGVLLVAAIAWFSFTGWLELGGETYYVAGGKFVEGFLETNGGTYYFDEKGRMQTGWENTGGSTYFFDFTGAMLTGWQTINGSRYYFQDNGAMWVGWMTAGNEKYYFDTDGVMLTGWQEIMGTDYYFDDNGHLVTGWVVDAAGNCSYFDEIGSMYTGWQNVDGNQYYFDPETGYKLTGWQTIDGLSYAFDADGIQLLGWVEDGGSYYYMPASLGGAMATGKWSIGGSGYYFDPTTGVMATGTADMGDGDVYYFGSDGKFQYRGTTESDFWGEWSEEDISFTTASGGNSWGGYQILSTMYENCTSITVTVEIVEVNEGSPDGQWQLHVRDAGGEWVRLGFFDVADNVGVADFGLDNISLDAIIATSYDIPDGWSGSLTLTIEELVYQSTDFGDVAGTE